MITDSDIERHGYQRGLEAAAKVADSAEERRTASWRAGLRADSHLEGMSDAADEIAALIRLLKNET
jgi:hypothetical protein